MATNSANGSKTALTLASFVLTPIILMSGRTLDSDIRYTKSLGADDYLPKSLDVDDLLAVVQGKLLAAERLQNLFDLIAEPMGQK
jgi:DNA-binding response OmpR family regulator